GDSAAGRLVARRLTVVDRARADVEPLQRHVLRGDALAVALDGERLAGDGEVALDLQGSAAGNVGAAGGAGAADAGAEGLAVFDGQGAAGLGDGVAEDRR